MQIFKKYIRLYIGVNCEINIKNQIKNMVNFNLGHILYMYLTHMLHALRK